MSGSGTKTASATLAVGGTFANTAALTVSAGNLDVEGAATIGASITMGTAAATVDFASTVAVSAISTLENTADNSTGTITFNNTTAIADNVTFTVGDGDTGAISFAGINGPGSLTINTDNTTTLTAAVTALGTLTLTSGNLNTNNKGITAANIIVNGGTFNSSSSTKAGTWDIGNVTIGGSGTLKGTTGTFTVSGNWSNVRGTDGFVHNGGTVTFDGNGTSTITGSTTFYNFTCTTAGKTLTFDTTSEKKQTITNFTLTGADGNNIIVNSNDSGTQAEIVVTNSAVSFVNVKDSNNSGTAITATNSINGGNNTGWLFTSTISGIVYTDAGSTADATSRTISISVNGSTTLTSGTSTADTGAYSIAAGVLSNNDVVTIYIDGDAVYGSTVIISDATDNITNADVYENYLRLDAEGSTNVTNANLTTAKTSGDSDSDLKFTTGASDALTVTQSSGIYAIKYAPGANITASPGITVPSGSTVAADSYSFAINGAATIDGTLSISTGTVTTSGLSDINGTLSISSTGTYTANGASDIDGILSIAGGTYDANDSFDASNGNITFTGAGNLKLGGSTTSLGELTSTVGTVWYDGAGNQDVVEDTYFAMNLSGGGTKTLAGNVTVESTLTSGAAGFTLDSNTLTIGTSNTGTGSWVNTATTVTTTGSTVVYGDTEAQTVLNTTLITGSDGDGITYNAMTLSGSGIKTFSGITTATGGITVNGSVTVDGGSAENTIVQAHETAGEANRRVITVEADKTVTISDMTIRNGKGTGAGIYNAGILSINNCTISNNSGSGDHGGGIFNYGTITELTNSTINNNTTQNGGGITNWTDKTITLISNCTISNNSATTNGGGIYNKGAITLLTNSTIANNSAGTFGGGISQDGTALTVRNTIIANNLASPFF